MRDIYAEVEDVTKSSKKLHYLDLGLDGRGRVRGFCEDFVKGLFYESLITICYDRLIVM